MAGKIVEDMTSSESVRCMLMRGGTSKGAYFLADDLPRDEGKRDELLLRIMGSPDSRQIDGLGGAHPLTSKVAIVSVHEGWVEYLFLQVGVESASVSTSQNCGNILAGVGPFAVERGLVVPREGETRVPIRMLNTGGEAVAHVPVHDGRVVYDGETAIAGVPGTASPIVLDFQDTAGSTCGTLFPTGTTCDQVLGVDVTCVDNGMPTVLLRADDLGLDGDEIPHVLESDARLRRRLEEIRVEAGTRMGIPDVASATVPKMSIISPPRSGGAVCTRTFIPHRCHTSIGVLAAASVAAGILAPGTVADGIAVSPRGPRLMVEHPTGELEVELEFDGLQVKRTAIVRTARPIMDGLVYPRPRA